MSRQVGVLLLGAQADGAALGRAIRALRAAGAEPVVAALLVADGVQERDRAVVRGLAAAGQAHGPRFRRGLRGADGPDRLWLHVREDDWIADRIKDVDLVVSLDQPAGPAATRLAQLHRHLRVADGVEAAVEKVRHGAEPGRRARATAAAITARLEEQAARRRRADREARRACRAARKALRLLRQGHDAGADEVVVRALEKVEQPRLRADLLGDVVSWSLAHGRQPRLARDAYAAELRVAEQHYAAGEYDEAAGSFTEAMRTAFHPVLHFDAASSPLADDPRAYTEPLRHSAVAGALRHGRLQERAGRPAPERAEGRRTRLLIATQHNADFLGEIREHFTAHPGFETRFEKFQDSAAVNRFGRHPHRLLEHVLAGRPGLPRALESTFREHLDRSDVVLVEWATALAALVSRLDHPGTRIVVRLHSYEAFSQWPHLTDWSNVDDLILVSEHLRDLVRDAIPGLSGPGAPRLHVIPNAMDLRRFVRPKDDEARFTLGVVGASKLVKDPRWAIEVVRRLREYDGRYRLLLIRSRFQDTSAATHAYADALERDLAELEPLGAVVPMKHTDDVPAALQQVGVVVSSSVRESFHMGLVEGVASGALPVVRDWPYFPGAARQLFPEDWVVDTPQRAADRVLGLTQDADTWRRETSAAARHVLEKWDWTVVRGRFEELLRR